MYDLKLHYLLAKVTLLLLLATTSTGLVLLFRKSKGWHKKLQMVHIIAGILTLLFFLLTYFLAPKI